MRAPVVKPSQGLGAKRRPPTAPSVLNHLRKRFAAVNQRRIIKAVISNSCVIDTGQYNGLFILPKEKTAFKKIENCCT